MIHNNSNTQDSTVLILCKSSIGYQSER